MYILVSGATTTVRLLLDRHPNLGVLLTPNDGNAMPPPGVLWAADNSAFSGFDDCTFRAFLARIAGSACRWVTAPDVVGDATETMALWPTWRDIIREHCLSPALVAQDGLTARDVPWREVGGVFIGGTTRYKLSEAAVEIVAEGNRRNVWTHMGRVNTARRILFAAAIGCRSVDGSSFSRFSKTHLPWALRLATQQPICFAGDVLRPAPTE